jgi:ketosteroid isomerase-like protein
MNGAVGLSAAANLGTVRDIYDAFGRGQIDAILDRLAENVQWEQWTRSFAQRADVPWLKARSGHDGAVDFFSIVGTFEIIEFSVLDLMASEHQVTAEVVIEAKVPGGGRFRDEELHLWSFDATGNVSRMRHYTDTAKHIAAAAGQDTTAA